MTSNTNRSDLAGTGAAVEQDGQRILYSNDRLFSSDLSSPLPSLRFGQILGRPVSALPDCILADACSALRDPEARRSVPRLAAAIFTETLRRRQIPMRGGRR
ncbi:MAG TPA: hypothetical protein VKU00_15835 [Chthonomonadaceae bacterium]|nr:hypothetical protein [Chthonomonadaceae bacterium]